jgi:hypothetical protein
MTFKTLRRFSIVAVLFNLALALIALLRLAARVNAYVSAQVPWPLWQDFDLVASAIWAGGSAFTVAVLWASLRKTRRGPVLEALQARQRRKIQDLELAVQKAELQKRLNDLTKPT